MPIMNLHERVLSVLGCKYTDDVLIDAPLIITEEMIDSLSINIVLHGNSTEDPSYMKYTDDNDYNNSSNSSSSDKSAGSIDRYVELCDKIYEVPRRKNIFKTFNCQSTTSYMDIVDRIQDRRDLFFKKFQKKQKSEREFYKNKYNHQQSDGQ